MCVCVCVCVCVYVYMYIMHMYMYVCVLRGDMCVYMCSVSFRGGAWDTPPLKK